MRSLMLAAATVLWAQGAAAQMLVSSDGVFYAETVNNDGTILRGLGETIYLGRGCDALIEGLGRGDWWWSRRGTVVAIGRYRVLFPDQIPDLSPGRCVL